MIILSRIARVSGVPLLLSRFPFRSLSLSSLRVSVPTADASLGRQITDCLVPAQSTRTNRPGKNSYLKVMFQNGGTVSRLHSVTVNLQEQLAQHESNGGAGMNEPKTEAKVNESQAPNDSLLKLRMKPRSLDSLHMTLFFAGETLCNELSKEELQTWYNQIRDRFSQSEFHCTSPPSEVHPQQNHEFWFRFARLRTFPPTRNTLIVAEFEASPAWHKLHNDLQMIARDSECSALQEIVELTKKKWVPHITLANIHCPSRAGMTAMRECLDNASGGLVTEEKIISSGISIGGPMPLKDELNWNFVYRGNVSKH